MTSRGSRGSQLVPPQFSRCQRLGQNPRKKEMAEEVDSYEPPCRQLRRERHLCEKCGKRLTLHTLLYRHVCDPLEARRERVVIRVREAAEAPKRTPSASAGSPPPQSLERSKYAAWMARF